MTKYPSEAKAFRAAGDKVAALCKEGKPNCGYRVLPTGQGGYKVLMVPERTLDYYDGLPFYL